MRMGQVVSSALRLSASTVVMVFVTAAYWLVIARCVSADELGLWVLIQLFVQYGQHATFAAPTMVFRDLPQARARTEHDAEQSMVRGAWAVILVVNGVLSLVAVVLGLALALGWSGAGVPAWVPAIVVGLTASWHVTVYCRYLLLATHRARVVDAGNYLRCVLLGLSAACTARWGMPGFVVSYLVVHLLHAAYLFCQLEALHRPVALDPGDVGGVIWRGMPLTITGYLSLALYSTDRWIIAAMLGQQQLAFYFPAAQVLMLVPIVAQSFVVVLLPVIAEEYGRSRTLVSVLPMATRGLGLVMLAGALQVATGGLLLGPFIETVLPRYSTGTLAAQIALVAGAILCLCEVPQGVALLHGENLWLSIALMMATLASLAGGLALVGRLGIAGAAAGSLIGAACYLGLLMARIAWIAHRSPRS